MPRAFDLYQAKRDHDPLANLLDFGNIDQTAELAGGLIKSFIDGMLDGVVQVIKDLTGLDLQALADVLEGLDFSTPEAFLISLMNAVAALPEALVEVLTQLIVRLTSPEGAEELQQILEAAIALLLSLPTMVLDLATGLIESGAGLLGIDSPLNAELLFNIINPLNLGELPFFNIGQSTTNLLANPSFEGAVSVQGSGLWHWDAVIGRTTPGSVYTTAAGAARQLVSNAIPVSTGQKLNLSIFAQWAGLAYTGTGPIKIQVARLLNYDHVGVDDLAIPAIVSPGANQSTWLQLGKDYTVPAGCDRICLQLVIADTATAGTVRFDDGDVHKTGSESTFIPNFNVTGVGGVTDIGQTVQETWNNLISGFVGLITPTGGAAIVDMQDIGFDVSSWASLGRMGWDILGIRNNKTIDSGLLATSGSNFSLGRVAMQASAPTIAVTQAVSAIGFMRMEQSNDKGVVSWLGSGVANITACYVNIWKMDSTTGDMTLMHRSPNIAGNLSASMAWVIYEMPAALLTTMSETYGIEITVVGSGTHTVAGTTTWIPNHPNVFPKSYAATRNSGTGTPTLGTVIPNASVAYSTNIPWIEWGITVGGAPSTHTIETTQLTTVGSSSIPIPTWANYVDVIAIGGGGGGAAGGFYGLAGGNGGAAGAWAVATWARGTDYTGAATVSTTVGAAGTGTISGVVGTNGANSVASITGHTVTAAGGTLAGGAGQGGDGAGNQSYGGFTYVGGGSGAAPGGGGASGSDFSGGPGSAGGAGRVWLVFRAV